MPPRSAERRLGKADRRQGPVTCTVDVGGSHLEAARVDAEGRPLGHRHKVDTPDPLTPDSLLGAVATMGERLQPFDRASIGINGLVYHRTIYAVPITGDGDFRRFDLAAQLSQRWARPVRVLNDAVMHGLGVIRGSGVELVITLGTVARLIDTQRVLTNFEHLYVGGGNAKRLTCALPADASLVDNHGALLGGVRAWLLDPEP